MSQPRRTKVFAAALISIVITAVALESLNSSPVPAGAFSLSEYYRLSPIETLISSNIMEKSRSWNSIEISYIGTKKAINSPLSQSGLVNYNFRDYHFIVCSRFIGGNGQIKVTENWEKQLPAPPGQRWGDEQTIQIGIIADSKITFPTDFQIKRVESLAKRLSEKFGIQVKSIYYHDYWY